MNYRELKKLVDKDKDIFKNIYICNFFTCRIEKMEKTKKKEYKLSHLPFFHLSFQQNNNSTVFKST